MDLQKVSGLDKEIEDGLYCPKCLPSCSDSTYKVTSTSLPLVKDRRNYANILYVTVKFKNNILKIN